MNRSLIKNGALVCCAVILPATRVSVAQPLAPRLMLGFEIGYGAHYHSGGFSLAGARGEQIPYVQGNGGGLLAGVAGEYMLDRNGGMGMQFECVFEQKPGDLSSKPAPFTAHYADSTTVHYVFSGASLHVTYNLVDIAALFRYDILPHLGVRFGPAIGFAVAHAAEQNGVMPYAAVSASGDTILADTMNFTSQIPGANAVRIGAVLGVQYAIPLGGVQIAPSISYDFALTNVERNDPWSVSTLQAAVDVEWGL